MLMVWESDPAGMWIQVPQLKNLSHPAPTEAAAASLRSARLPGWHHRLCQIIRPVLLSVTR